MSTPWCPVCREETEPTPAGTCAWCDTPTVPKVGRRRGVWGYLTDEQLRACHALYEQGLSLRQIAEMILPRTRYSTVASCRNCLQVGFRRLRLPLRDRLDATRAANARRVSGVTRTEQRRRRGEIVGKRCAGVKTQPPHLGAPCGRYALRGGVYCRSHDPARRDEVLVGLAEMRRRLGRAA